MFCHVASAASSVVPAYDIYFGWFCKLLRLRQLLMSNWCKHFFLKNIGATSRCDVTLMTSIFWNLKHPRPKTCMLIFSKQRFHFRLVFFPEKGGAKDSLSVKMLNTAAAPPTIHVCPMHVIVTLVTFETLINALFDNVLGKKKILLAQKKKFNKNTKLFSLLCQMTLQKKNSKNTF